MRKEGCRGREKRKGTEEVERKEGYRVIHRQKRGIQRRRQSGKKGKEEERDERKEEGR